ncbi:protein FAR1-RELATED SEQUENCE 11-like [Salvia miltiorrhiza]|uniref:protein FAR1-RELATED SEQUENCE 11-like n=1 Tax=Salvia miltiorrhiza TaxID=226208 RepID=UPI0025ACF890|nr:protein FAR1-RELATED SEQUENCE 11-like [Salvia miltiorrhiza]
MNIDLNASPRNDGLEDSFTDNLCMDAFPNNDDTSEDEEEQVFELSSSPHENYSSDDAEAIGVGEDAEATGDGEDDEETGDGDDDDEATGDGEDCRQSKNSADAKVADTEVGECSVQVSKQLVESLLNVGCYVDTLDEVHVLYREYGRLSGFSVRKGSQSYFLNSMTVRSKMYNCSCEGLPDNKCSIERVPVCKRQSYRCNCKVKLRVARDEGDSPWKVTIFDNDHNHKLLDPSESYLLRSARNMSQSKKTLLIALTSSGIGVSRAYRFLENEAGCRANVGFLRKDVYNALNIERREMSKVENVDVNRLIEYFTDKGLRDPLFYWKVKVGDDG